MDKKNNNRDIILFISIFIVSIIVTYYTPSIFNTIWFFGLLAVFFFSKTQDNCFWVILFWFFISAPGAMFGEFSSINLPSIPVFFLGRNVRFSELFALVAIIKALLNPVDQSVFYRKPLYLLIIYAVFLIFLGFFYGMGLLRILRTIRFFVPFLLILFLPKLLPYDTVPRTIKLIFIAALILIFTQLYNLYMGYPMASVLGETIYSSSPRVIYGPFIILLSFILSMLLLTEEGKYFRQFYLYFISYITSISIFLSATRGWILAVGLFIVGFALFQTKKFSAYFLIGFLIIVLLLTIPFFNEHFIRAYERLLTLEPLLEGDETLEGTLGRTVVYSPPVMEKFMERPIFGFGFSDEYAKYANPHVGNQNLLLNGGLVGYAAYLYFILFVLSTYLRSFIREGNKKMIAFFLGLLGVSMIHSTSRMVFAYLLDVQTALFLSLFLFISDYYLKKKDAIAKNESHTFLNVAK